MPEQIEISSRRITVALDAMGGDQAPDTIIAGAVAAARANSDIDVTLVGDEAVVRRCLASSNAPANVRVAHAAQVIEMCDPPGQAVRQKPQSSIVVGMRLVRDGHAQAMISAGNSGAMMAAAMVILKPQPGIDRPAIATLVPTRHGRAILLDAGATTDCKPAHLVQFARLGNQYAATLFGCSSPRVGLLSIGEEPTKGDELTKETHRLLLETDLNFIGNVEPKEMMRGEVEVVVCDGFVGNLMLKTGEAFSELLMNKLKENMAVSWLRKAAALVLRPVFSEVKKHFDYAEYGGALLLGVNGIVLISHGRSDQTAIENAVCVAAQAARRHASINGAVLGNRLLHSVTG